MQKDNEFTWKKKVQEEQISISGPQNFDPVNALANADFQNPICTLASYTQPGKDKSWNYTVYAYKFIQVDDFQICVAAHAHITVGNNLAEDVAKKENWKPGNCYIPGLQGWSTSTPRPIVDLLYNKYHAALAKVIAQDKKLIGGLILDGAFPGDERYPKPISTTSSSSPSSGSSPTSTASPSLSSPSSSSTQTEKQLSQEKNYGQKQETRGKDEDQKETGFLTRPIWGGKPVWSWMKLLIIPFVLAVGASLFSAQQHDVDQQRALDQQQAAILQAYIDNIQDLLIHNNLRKSHLGDEVAILARARTLTALQGLDSQRKGVLVHFLYEANLIGFSDPSGQDIHPPIIFLFGANLIGANLAGVPLSGADLIEIDLSGAHLARADLSGAVLGEAHLSEADMEGANLSDAQLYGADMKGADLIETDLSEAHLKSANLSKADLRGAHLSGADLFDADLSGTSITQQQLDQVNSCQYAILPDGLTCHHNQ